VHRAHDVGREGADRIAEAVAHDRLRREVHEDLRAERAHRRGEARGIVHVAHLVRGEPRRKARALEEARRRGRREGEAGDARSHPREPCAEPPAHESRVPGHEDLAPAPPAGIRERTHRR
jgi:hypothetical protein